MLGILTHAWEYGLSHASEFEQALGDHLVLVGTALGISILLCIPLGIWTARSRLASLTIMNLINALRVIPSLAVLFLLIPILGLNTTSATVALTVLAMPPILINTDAAFRNLDPAVIEAAQGMGMTAGQVLRRIEFPLALPVILTGIRTAAVEIISSATLAAFVGSGGLGIYITRGFALYDYGILMLGAAPVALLTLIAETILALLQRLFQPPA
ncbi:MAG: ABC transporter permease [Chloroflexi bacterium]|nr:ABC transporter permease [Chloroflexota bacterium]